ncbi:PSD1 and planctomycete cytochrome C domain-containing protein [Luteolibacter marinus]|uniref:PSD1 and planctomycete cytochrome C domain-containing protein n=1 Tax=Luteolibacter marinus TaxID=2776705 RepID=UPI001867EC5D|nr:PSD1 and planctomycete cytochrome C domain-containing protein [Luteolibacter marinus]
MRYGIAIMLLSALPVWAKVDFAHDVRPILNAHCTSCHGGVKEAGEVSFIYREQALGKGESGKPIIVPGDPAASELMVRVLSGDPDEVMPKPEHGPPLAKEEIETLRTWIEEGAEWGEHWSFVAPVRQQPPAVKDAAWPRNDIDRFLLARMESEGLEPSKEAAKSVLLRRLSLDLTGLPPSVEELDAFLADSSPDAYAKQVDRLLASPHFGERWASVWMDLARYADSEGLGVDRRREVWKYRDWLVDAFNRDLPFDQFTIDQLAGDLIPDASLEQKIATTFHRLTQVNDEGGTDDEEFRVSAVMDRVATTWEVWQGLTFGCVQCHSHPYDPIKHEEYYSFMAFFNQTADADLSEDLPKLKVPLDKARYAEANGLQDQVAAAESALFKIRAEIDAATRWSPARSMTATAQGAKLRIAETGGIEEYRSDTNAAAGATYQLTFPADLSQLTALRVEFLPLDEDAAAHTPEWGAILKKITLEILDPDNGAKPVALAEVIADEAHPFFDPNGSLKDSNRGWGTYSKTFGPRHATVVLAEPLDLPEGSRLRVTMKNGPSIIASFPMVSKRGRISLTDQAAWITHRKEAEVLRLKKELSDARAALRKIPATSVPVMQERDPRFSRSTRVFNRGNWLDKGGIVEKPGTPEVFPRLHAASEVPSRLDLARWIASPENPLTARVAVNRMWLELFGIGIVPTPEDFGSAGEKPTHPGLLDTLAVRFSTEMQWSVKSLLRELVTSAAYRQDATVTPALAAKDADNRLLARGPRQRLTAEMARDNALAVGGLLAPAVGGPPVHPPIPPGVWTPFSADSWKTPEPGQADRYRRSLYTYWKRSIPYPSFVTFDAPTRELCSKRRLVSNTPLQALAVLNDPAFHECAQGLARRMKYDVTGDLDARLSFGYRAATSKDITADRLDELRGLFKDTEQRYAADPGTMNGMAGTPDGAAYTIVASVLLNLDEAITR